MIRFVYRLFCAHEWRELYFPRYYNHKNKGASDCLKCGALKRHPRPSHKQVLIDLVAAIETINKHGHTLAKERQLDDALNDAKAMLYVEIQASIKNLRTGSAG